MKYMIRRVSPVSVFRITFFLYWVVGIIVAVMYGVFFGIMAMIPGVLDDPEMGGLGQVMGGIGAFAIIVGGFFVSILYGVFGAGTSVLLAIAYNALARTVGGFEMELEEKDAGAFGHSDFGLKPPQEPNWGSGSPVNPTEHVPAATPSPFVPPPPSSVPSPLPPAGPEA